MCGVAGVALGCLFPVIGVWRAASFIHPFPLSARSGQLRFSSERCFARKHNPNFRVLAVVEARRRTAVCAFSALARDRFAVSRFWIARFGALLHGSSKRGTGSTGMRLSQWGAQRTRAIRRIARRRRTAKRPQPEIERTVSIVFQQKIGANVEWLGDRTTVVREMIQAALAVRPITAGATVRADRYRRR